MATSGHAGRACVISVGALDYCLNQLHGRHDHSRSHNQETHSYSGSVVWAIR